MRSENCGLLRRLILAILIAVGSFTAGFSQVPKIGSDSTLDIATWNIEWFGDSINGPNNEVTQLKNVTEVITSMDMDIMALCEVSNPGYWQKLQNNLTEYGAVITTYTQTQKTALLYRKSMFKLLYSKSILLAYDYEFASGRFPLEVALETQWGAKKDTVYCWVIHLKANTGSTSEKLASYDRRAKAAEELKKYLDPKKRLKGWVLGDWNDDLDVSIVSGKASPYLAWRNDTNYVFPSYRLALAKQKSTANYSEMIDHMSCLPAMKSNWLLNQSGVMVGDAYIGSYRLNTSDHYPVWAKFSMDFKALDFLGNDAPMMAKPFVYWNGAKWEIARDYSASPISAGDTKIYDLSSKLIFSGRIEDFVPQSEGVNYLQIVRSNGEIFQQILVRLGA
jgi:endonuclease/exonuclease/phosphatase family metal-dependent hydrolase